MDWKTLVGFTIIFHGIVYAWKRSWILRLDTKKLNKCINGISQHRIRKYLRVWFRLGSYVTILIGFPFTLWLFLRTIFYALAPSIVSLFFFHIMFNYFLSYFLMSFFSIFILQLNLN